LTIALTTAADGAESYKDKYSAYARPLLSPGRAAAPMSVRAAADAAVAGALCLPATASTLVRGAAQGSSS
jgi:hypothetical protein